MFVGQIRNFSRERERDKSICSWPALALQVIRKAPPFALELQKKQLFYKDITAAAAVYLCTTCMSVYYLSVWMWGWKEGRGNAAMMIDLDDRGKGYRYRIIVISAIRIRQGHTTNSLVACIQGGWSGCRTGNGKKLSSSQAQLGQVTYLAVD